MAYGAFTPIGGLLLSAGATSAATLIPTTGSPSVALISNFGSTPVRVSLGGSGVVADYTTGVVVMPGSQLPVEIGANTYIAVAALSGTAGVHVALGS